MTVPIFLDVETTGVGPDARLLSYALHRDGLTTHGLVQVEEDITNSHIHGITSIVSREFGERLEISLSIIQQWLRPDSDLEPVLLIGHNIDNDKRTISAEADRLGQMISWPLTFCTMRALARQCGLRTKVGYANKPPTLAEAYRWMFDQEPEGLHCARTDMLACRAIYIEGQRRGLWQ